MLNKQSLISYWDSREDLLTKEKCPCICGPSLPGMQGWSLLKRFGLVIQSVSIRLVIPYESISPSEPNDSWWIYEVKCPDLPGPGEHPAYLLSAYCVHMPRDRRGKAMGTMKNSTVCFSRDQQDEVGDRRKDYRVYKVVVSILHWLYVAGFRWRREHRESTPRGRRG